MLSDIAGFEHLELFLFLPILGVIKNGGKMKNMIIMGLVLVMVAGVLVTCGVKDQENTTKSLELTTADNGKTIDVAVGTQINLTLGENQTTPVHWQDLPEIEGDATISDVTSEYITDPNPDGRMGVGGNRVFKFETKTAGTIKLAFTSTHIANKEEVYDKFEVTLVVK